MKIPISIAGVLQKNKFLISPFHWIHKSMPLYSNKSSASQVTPVHIAGKALPVSDHLLQSGLSAECSGPGEYASIPTRTTLSSTHRLGKNALKDIQQPAVSVNMGSSST